SGPARTPGAPSDRHTPGIPPPGPDLSAPRSDEPGARTSTRPTTRSATAPAPAPRRTPGSGTRSAALSGTPTAARAAGTGGGTPSHPASSAAADSAPRGDT